MAQQLASDWQGARTVKRVSVQIKDGKVHLGVMERKLGFYWVDLGDAATVEGANDAFAFRRKTIRRRGSNKVGI